MNEIEWIMQVATKERPSSIHSEQQNSINTSISKFCVCFVGWIEPRILHSWKWLLKYLKKKLYIFLHKHIRVISFQAEGECFSFSFFLSLSLSYTSPSPPSFYMTSSFSQSAVYKGLFFIYLIGEIALLLSLFFFKPSRVSLSVKKCATNESGLRIQFKNVFDRTLFKYINELKTTASKNDDFINWI